MKLVVSHVMWDFAKVEKVFYRHSVLGNGFPIEVRMSKGGFFNDAEEVVRVATEECAQQLVCAITEAWASGVTLFNVDEWLDANSFAVWAPAVSSRELEWRRDVENLIGSALECRQLLAESEHANENLKTLFEKLRMDKIKEN